MIAITPPKIFSKEVAKNRPPHFPARTSSNFRGWRLDENLKPKSPPYRGAHIDVRWPAKNEVGPRPAPPCCAPAPAPPSWIAIAMRCMQPFFPLRTVQKWVIAYTLGGAQAEFIRMKSTSKKRTPSIVNLTVKRRYLTEREVERLMDCARVRPLWASRRDHDLVAYRHGLRASEVCDL